MSDDIKALDFEKSLQQLEALVEAMENGDLGLEESLQAFEKGVALTRACQAALDNAEQRVNLLLQENGKPVEQPFTQDNQSDTPF
jgi:exodeoxyribonuclease VII small subunit